MVRYSSMWDRDISIGVDDRCGSLWRKCGKDACVGGVEVELDAADEGEGVGEEGEEVREEGLAGGGVGVDFGGGGGGGGH